MSQLQLFASVLFACPTLHPFNHDFVQFKTVLASVEGDEQPTRRTESPGAGPLAYYLTAEIALIDYDAAHASSSPRCEGTHTRVVGDDGD